MNEQTMSLPSSLSSSLPCGSASTASALSTSSSVLNDGPHQFFGRFVNCTSLVSSFQKPFQSTSNCSPSISYSEFMPSFPLAWILCRRRGSLSTGKVIRCRGGRSSRTGIGATNLTFMGCSSFQVSEAKQSGKKDGVGKTPVLLFDIMGTIVRDPFYEDVPAFFGISMKELLATKHPTAWIEFEKGLITEEELICKFFNDQRDFDSHGLKNCMTSGYAYLEGVEGLLDRLKSSGYQIHAFTNYPLWYKMIEDKLKLSRYLTWTFVSCHTGRRKPDHDAYVWAANQLELSPSSLIFIDDQSRNVEAATQIGMIGLAFQDAKKLEKDLLSLGMVF